MKATWLDVLDNALTAKFAFSQAYAITIHFAIMDSSTQVLEILVTIDGPSPSPAGWHGGFSHGCQLAAASTRPDGLNISCTVTRGSI